MCDTCGCNITPGNAHLVAAGGRHEHTEDGRASVNVLKSLLSENDHQAAHNRAHFNAHGVLAINLMSSPGSGKTTLLEKTIEALGDKLRIAVIEGDLETENDAERIRAQGADAIQITTGSACHLDAHLVHDALHHLDLAQYDLVFIENVGNLVCPASFDLGQQLNVVLLSTTEGDDKPAKYPVMFRAADLVVLSKTDLLPYLTDFDPKRAARYLQKIGHDGEMIHTAQGQAPDISTWLEWIQTKIAEQKKVPANPEIQHHTHDAAGKLHYHPSHT